jgi:retron-type reverse transcriptase
MNFWTEIVSEKNLNKAWNKVHSQNSAPGIDGLSVSGFALNADPLLAEIRNELCSGTFSFSAVKICSIISGSKKREIGLCTVRDKIVQNSIAAVLNVHFEPYLSPAAHAYRQGKSANQAVHKVRDFFKQGYTHCST